MKLTYLAAATLLALAGPALAQTAAPASPTKPGVTAPAAPAASNATRKTVGGTPGKRERSAKSLDCSKQADAKALHGKARKKFRQSCMKG